MCISTWLTVNPFSGHKKWKTRYVICQMVLTRKSILARKHRKKSFLSSKSDVMPKTAMVRGTAANHALLDITDWLQKATRSKWSCNAGAKACAFTHKSWSQEYFWPRLSKQQHSTTADITRGSFCLLAGVQVNLAFYLNRVTNVLSDIFPSSSPRTSRTTCGPHFAPTATAAHRASIGTTDRD